MAFSASTKMPFPHTRSRISSRVTDFSPTLNQKREQIEWNALERDDRATAPQLACTAVQYEILKKYKLFGHLPLADPGSGLDKRNSHLGEDRKSTGKVQTQSIVYWLSLEHPPSTKNPPWHIKGGNNNA